MGEIHDLVIRHGRTEARKRVPTEQKRLIDLAAEILGDEEGSIAYMYSGFAMTTLPHRPLPDNDIWERKNGRLSLIVEPGVLPENGVAKKYGVPYGSRARLIMFYLQTEAIKTRSRVIRLGNSMTDWMVRMGINPGGSNFNAVRDQTRRLSACRLTVGWMADDGSNGFQRENIVSAMINPPPDGDPRQGRFWEETAELSEGFYQALLQHPVPCEEKAIRLIQNSSTVIDIYIWLCYRLHALKAPVMVPWVKLHEQFGLQYKTVRQFKPRFLDSLREAVAVYPDANIEVLPEGVKLRPSPPAIRDRRSYAVLLPPAG
ncbi:MAG TPA: replication protein RepA [Azospirillaceae bacterium]|nr:replication protein RepA [Azospirillaceae bacterium]